MKALSLNKRPSSNGPVGLDLDGSYLAAAAVDGPTVTRAVSADLPPGAIGEGEVRDVEALTAAVKAFAREHRLPKRVRLGVSNQQIVVRQIEIPLIEDVRDRDAAVRFQAAEAIAMPLEETILDYQITGDRLSPEGATQLQVIVVAARQSMIARVLEAVRGAGLKPEGVDLNAFALVRALSDTDEFGGDHARVYCHLGGVTNFAVAVGRTCLFTRPLSTTVEDAGDYAAASLAEEIRLSIDYYMGQPDAPLASEVILSGPGTADEGLADELSGLIGLPVSVADPLGRLTAEGISDGEDPRRHTVAVGLALGAAA